MGRNIIVLATLAIVVGLSFFALSKKPFENSKNDIVSAEPTQTEENTVPMSIENLRKRSYPGSDIIIEEMLSPGINYTQYIASYLSEGLKIYGLLTVPTSPKPAKGFPSIIFMHGYIDPKIYSTTQNYALYQAVLARNNFITFKPDLRGHRNSEGSAPGAHFSEAYVVDNLNAVSSLKKYKDTDPSRIGYWGHSNGGEIGLRSMVVSKDIKAGVFWAGVVGSFKDMLETYNAKIPFMQTTPELVKTYGKPSQNPSFWNQLDPYNYLADISGPIQTHHGTADSSVPVQLSQRLTEELKKANKPVELFVYEGDDNNITANFTPAWQRTVDFFKKTL